MRSDDFVEGLIPQVFQHRCLYDKRAVNFRNKSLKERLWDEIGNNLGKSADECQKRWRSLRERFSRELRKQNEPSESGAVDKGQWKYYEALIFLEDHVAPRQSISNASFDNHLFEVVKEENLGESVSEEETIAYVETSSSPIEPKRRRTDEFNSLYSISTKKVEELHPETSDINADFMRITTRLLDELPPQAQEETRAKIFQLVSDMRLEHIYN